MKQIFTRLFLSAIVALLFGQNATAQVVDKDPDSPNFGQVVWLGTEVASNPNKYVYLYNVGTGQFINAGLSFGVQAVLSSIGMRMTIEQAKEGGNNAYLVKSRIDNPAVGQCMSPYSATGDVIYLDRKDTYGNTGGINDHSWPNWVFVHTSGSVTVNGQTYTTHTYKLYNYNLRNNTNPYIGATGRGGAVSWVGQNGSNNEWRIITEEDYRQAMDQVTWGEVDLGAFVQDAEFGRSNLDGRYWVWSTNGAGGAPATATDSENQTYTLDTQFTGTGALPANTHWHQRNQNDMVGGYVYANGGGDVIAQNIPQSRIGENVLIGVSGSYNANGNYASSSFRTNIAQYYAAEIYNEVNSLTQTLHMSGMENLEDGLYKLTAQALYWDGNQGRTNDDASYFVVTTKTGTEEPVTQRLLITPMNMLSTNYNITPLSGVSAGYVFDNNPNAYKLEFFVELRQDTELTIGIESAKTGGWTVIGNVHLYAHGKQTIFVDEEWCPDTKFSYINNEQKEWSTQEPYMQTRFYDRFEYPSTLYFTRTFTKDKFNPICLPVDLTGDQVRQAFGNNCMLSEFVGLKDNGNCISFKLVNLDADDEGGIVMHKGVPYIVKVTTDPIVAQGSTLELEVGNGHENHTITLKGPVYSIPGVTKEDYNGQLPELVAVTKDGITFQGTFYFTTIGVDELANKDFWLIRRGDMYHLDGSNPNKLYAWDSTPATDLPYGQLTKTNNDGYMIWGTYAYLSAPKSSAAKNFTFEVEDLEGFTTAIDVVGMDQDAVRGNTSINDNHVYTLNGQKLSGKGTLNSLSKGIYIVNGKKFVVK